MPDGSLPIRPDAGSDRTERLNSAIDRMLAGGPTPVLNDPELRDLLQLAIHLRDELPDDLPDPAFRYDLKRQLTANGPVPITARRPADAAQPRFPWIAAVSAIAAVMLAAISVGSLAIWLDNDSGDSPGSVELARTLSVQQTATTFGLATMTVAGVPGNDQAGTTAATDDPTNESSEAPGDDQPDPEATSADTVPPRGASAISTTPATPTTEATTTTEPTSSPSLAAVPPVDAQHVERGPGPAADGSGGPPGAVDYVLATSLPDLGTSADVYRLIPPQDDPTTFVSEIAAALGMEGNVTSSAPMGRKVFEIFDDAGSFHWTPETGSFTASLSEPGTNGPLTADELMATAIDWLESIDYPVDHLASDFSAEPIDDTTWLLTSHYVSMPDIGFGHHLGVQIFISGDGTISEISGYWLELKQVDSAALHSADAIWQAISSGKGYWTGGGIVEDGGEFRADSMRITYLLTRDPSGDLVLQPVVKTDGEFVTADGLSSARISCYVQAARTTESETP